MTDDADGTTIPDDLVRLWEQIPAIRRMLSDLNNISVALKSARDSNDPLWLEVNPQDALATVKLLKAQLQRAIPHAVCPACQGVLRHQCKLCKGRGAISKFLWDSPAVNDFIKLVRAGKVKR